MRKFLLISILLILVNAVLAKKVIVRGKILEWKISDQVVLLQKGVILRDDVDLSGDKIQVDIDNQKATVLGDAKVFFKKGDTQNIYGDYIFYDMKRYRGLIKNATVEAGLFLYRTKLVNFDFSQIRIPYGGILTSCPSKKPIYKIKVRRGYGVPGKYLELQHLTFYIKNKPLFVYPKKTFNLHEKPIFSWKLGYSGKEGLYYEGDGVEFGKREGWKYNFKLSTKRGHKIQASRQKHSESIKRNQSLSISFNNNKVLDNRDFILNYSISQTFNGANISFKSGFYNRDRSSYVHPNQDLNLNLTINKSYPSYNISVLFNKMIDVDGDKLPNDNYSGTFYLPKITVNSKSYQVKTLKLSLRARTILGKKQYLKNGEKEEFTERVFTLYANRQTLKLPTGGRLNLGGSYEFNDPGNQPSSVALTSQANLNQKIWRLNWNLSYRKTHRYRKQEWIMETVSEAETLNLGVSMPLNIGLSRMNFNLFSGTYDFKTQRFTSGNSSLNFSFSNSSFRSSLGLSLSYDMQDTRLPDFFALSTNSKLRSGGLNFSFAKEKFNLRLSSSIDGEKKRLKNINLGTTFQLGKDYRYRWYFDIVSNFDLDEGKLTSATFKIKKRLGCMLASFYLNPKSNEYYFTIGIGAIPRARFAYGYSKSEGFHKIDDF